MNKTFVIEYKIYFNDNNNSFSQKTTKVKNCLSDLHAKIKLEDYLKLKNNNFKQLVIISCKEDIISFFGDIFGFSK